MEKWLPAEGLWLDGGFIRQADSGIMHRAKWSMKDVELMRRASYLVGNDRIWGFSGIPASYYPAGFLLPPTQEGCKRLASYAPATEWQADRLHKANT